MKQRQGSTQHVEQLPQPRKKHRTLAALTLAAVAATGGILYRLHAKKQSNAEPSGESGTPSVEGLDPQS